MKYLWQSLYAKLRGAVIGVNQYNKYINVQFLEGKKSVSLPEEVTQIDVNKSMGGDPAESARKKAAR